MEPVKQAKLLGGSRKRVKAAGFANQKTESPNPTPKCVYSTVIQKNLCLCLLASFAFIRCARTSLAELVC